ncbi:DUF2523 domain-containing protein [Chromobacterium vaccinii]|uniref:DUF2523 domain-containing protein n=1 Tax=Chromobacterium vaccinii TaxID=1108595 RepID=UPI0006180CC2|nr:DUF2523 domain-containing protein [Chromobacterium vaccinii]
MATMSSFLVGMVKPIIGQILVSLGLSVVTYTGIQLIVDQLNQAIQTNLSGIPSIAANLLGLAGLGEALGIIVGAFAFRLSMNVFKRIEFKRS